MSTVQALTVANPFLVEQRLLLSPLCDCAVASLQLSEKAKKQESFYDC
jgi:hypothetical protein